MVRKLSIIRPTEVNRLDLFFKTQAVIEAQLIGVEYEIIVPSRSITSELDNVSYCTVVRYQYPNVPYFSAGKAWNCGIRAAKYKNIVFMSNEIMPGINTMYKIANHVEDNVVFQVFDLNAEGQVVMSLVNKNFRSGTPSMFFLAMFNKGDLYEINGFDERFIGTYAYEDDDFGARWGRTGIHFVVDDSITANHLWHPRGNLGQDGGQSFTLFMENNNNKVTYVKKGLQYI